jgi:hypothetical protein
MPKISPSQDSNPETQEYETRKLGCNKNGYLISNGSDLVVLGSYQGTGHPGFIYDFSQSPYMENIYTVPTE